MIPDTETLFRLANLAALIGWLPLLLAPLNRPMMVAVARVFGTLLALTYLALFVTGLDGLQDLAENYSAGGIAAAFSDPRAALVGWVHYLAFDLWVGSWEVEEAGRTGMPHWVLVPCLFLTFMAGPIGLLLFLTVRQARRRA